MHKFNLHLPHLVSIMLLPRTKLVNFILSLSTTLLHSLLQSLQGKMTLDKRRLCWLKDSSHMLVQLRDAV
jgi:hypothetical protein